MRTGVLILAILALLSFATPSVAQAPEPLVIDGLSLPRANQYEIFDAANQKYSPIDIRDVPYYVRQKARVYDRTAQAWVVDPGGVLNSRYVATASAAQTPAADPLVVDGLSLPRTHQYEIYDTKTEKYSSIDVRDVPFHARRKSRVFDRTAKLWVIDPSGNLNKRYAAPAPAAAKPEAATADNLVADGLSLPRAHRYEIYDTRTEKYSRIDVHDVAYYGRQKSRVFDRTAQQWVIDPSGNLNKRYVAPGAPGRIAAGPGDGQWHRLSGALESVQGPEVTIRTDDGRRAVIDLSQARWNPREAPAAGARVSAIGFMVSPSRLQARAIREVPGGAPGQTPSGAPEWERLHGQVEEVKGTTLRFRVDDGRRLDVDMSRVSPDVQRALKQGEGATVIGWEWTGATALRADYVQQDSSDPSRGGKVAAPIAPSR